MSESELPPHADERVAAPSGEAHAADAADTADTSQSTNDTATDTSQSTNDTAAYTSQPTNDAAAADAVADPALSQPMHVATAADALHIDMNRPADEAGAAVPADESPLEPAHLEGQFADSPVPSEPPQRLAGTAPGRPALAGYVARLRSSDWPIIAIVAVAAILRVFGYNWDEGADLHPDERGIVDHIRSIGLPHSWAEFWSPSSPLNPHFSAYGHLPFYATAVFSHGLGWLGRTIGGPLAGLAQADVSDPGIIESGRVLSGLTDAGTLVFVYLIGRMVFGRSVGLLAALLGCFTVLNLEFAHFANVDTFLAFFVMGALYFCVRIVRRGRPRDYIWAGAWIGFALACKVSAAPLIVPLIVAHVFRGAERETAAGRETASGTTPAQRAVPANPLLLLMALASTLIAVFVTMPYAFIDFTNWWNDVWGQLQLAQGITDSPYTRKFSGLPAYWYPLQQLIGWTMGLPLGLAAVAGVLVAIGRQVRRRRGSELVLLAWAAVFFGASAGQYMKYLRYMLPLAPVLTLFAAALLVALWRWARATTITSSTFQLPSPSFAMRPQSAMAPRAAPYAPMKSAISYESQAGRVLARALVVIVVGLTVLYGLAYENIYTTSNTRVAATRWMATHIPPNAAITVEDWDETLPMSVPGVVTPPYRQQQLSILGPGDSATTVPMFVQALQTAQYISISSARVFGSLAHQPGRYPYSIRWYDLLFGNKLNFRLVKSFTNPPHLGPIAINDYQAAPQAGYYNHIHLWYEADQNLSEYNSPPVYIFKRVGTIDPTRAQALLTHDDHGHLLAPAVAAYDPTHSMILSPSVEHADRTAPTYNSVFPPNNPLAQIPLLSWLVMIELLGLLALPLVMRACGGLLRDGGYALAKLCGIAVVGYLTWLAASVGIASYSRGLILGSCFILLLLSLGLGLRPRALWTELKARRRGILWAELIFIAAFLAWAGVRMAYPDLWHMVFGGERTQEISFTNAILRSQHFPPLDPWFAGGTLNYYYYGQYLTGMLMKLIGISVPVGFNLALPTLYALLLSIAFSIGFNATGRAWVGGAAVALEGVLGNLGMLKQFADLSPTHAPAFIVPGIAGLWDALNGIGAVLTHQVQLPGDFFWASSRILSSPSGDAINEYPIWSFTYGDMHAHVIDMPIVLGVIGLALAVSGLGAGGRGAAREGTRRSRLGPLQLLVLVGLMAVVAGATGPTNLWDLPTSVALLTAGFGLRGWFVAGRRGWPLVVRDVVVPGAVLGLLSLALYQPFYATVLGISSGFTFLQPHTPTDDYLLHLGLPLFLLTSFIVVFLVRHARLRRQITVLEFCLYYAARMEQLPRLFRVAAAMTRRKRPEAAPPSLLSAHILIFGLLLALVVLDAGFTTLALIAVLLTLGAIALVEACARAPHLSIQESQPFALVLALGGLALTAIPDIIMQNEAGRMNTFFKLYNQAWPLLALSGALALAALVPRRRAVAVEVEQRAPLRPSREPISSPAMASAVLAPQGAGASFGALGSGFAVPRMASTHIPGDVTEPARTEEQPPPTQPGEESSHGDGTVVNEVGGDAESEAATTAGAAQDAVPHSAGAPRTPRPSAFGGGFWRWRTLWWAVLVVLVFGGTLFPIFGIYTHLQLRSGWDQTANARIPNGLDGAAFVRVLYPGDYAAINWINANIHGTPVLLTSDRGGYRNFADKVTMFTGLPNIINWPSEDGQERYSGQQRPQSQFPPVWINQLDSGRVTWNGTRWVTNLPQSNVVAAGTRSNDAETIYNTTDPTVAMSLLREYHVSYIYVGIAERGDPNSYGDEVGANHYPRVGFDPAGLRKFDQMVRAGQLRVRYNKLGVTIYQVV